MEKIVIKRNPNGDTRTAPKGITFDQFKEANDMHRSDVYRVMEELSEQLYNRGITHDWTKKEYEQKFYDDFTKVMTEGGDFSKMEWATLHYDIEKHHPFRVLHPDYNLLDLIETIVDCTVAGFARSGEVRPLEINDEIIKLAVNNTVELIKSMITLED